MRTRFVEATQAIEGGFNHGKFMIARFDPAEWERPCELDERTDIAGPIGDPDLLPVMKARGLLRRCGWTLEHTLVMDLATGEGALFRPGGSPSADLDKHKVWVCPMFEPFLAWLYEFTGREVMPDVLLPKPGDPPPMGRGAVVPQPWFDRLPALVELPDVPGAFQGYRRNGPDLFEFKSEQERALVRALLRRHLRTIQGPAEATEDLLRRLQVVGE